MSYTKGPWSADIDDESHEVFDVYGKCRDGADGYLIAEVRNYNLREENIANARLIAAAPELLEALQKLERYFVSGNCIPIERAVITRDSFEEIARAAIEKATKP